jgi:hypothetical protein
MIVPMIPMEYREKVVPHDNVRPNLHRQKCSRKICTTRAAKPDNGRIPRLQFSINKGLSMKLLSSNHSVALMIITVDDDDDDEEEWLISCESRRSDSRNSNNTVRFSNVVTYIPTSDSTNEQVQEGSWITKQEHRQNRKMIHARQCRLMHDPEYRQAIDSVKHRLGQYNFDSGAINEEESNMDCTHSTRSLEEIEALAILLSRGDWRGLEKAALSGKRRWMMACFVSTIQNAYQNGMSDEYIADLCKQRSATAQAWAEALGRADAIMAVEEHNSLMLDLTSGERLEL